MTSSSRFGQPITHGPVDVDVAVGAAAAELFDFRSVPPPRGQRRGERQEWSLLPLAPILVARAENGNGEDGRIITEETWEKTRRG
jgi:hypothetical protein